MDGVIGSMDMSLRKLWEIAKDRDGWHAAIHGAQRVEHTWATTKRGQLRMLQDLLKNHKYCLD